MSRKSKGNFSHGVYVKVTVEPGAKRERVEKTAKGYLIRVREPAERNLANGRVRELLAKEYHVPIGAVRLIAGHRSSSKMFSISG